MLDAHQVEELICLVSAMDRAAILHHFRNIRAPFSIDFTDSFLQNTPLERLRHIFVALCLQCQHLPEFDLAPPAAA